MYKSADPLGCVYYNYFFHGDSLGYHFDNSEFFVNLVISQAKNGGKFEYVHNLRTETNDNYDEVKKVYQGDRSKLKRIDEIQDGSLLIFSGRYSIHRVVPIIGF